MDAALAAAGVIRQEGNAFFRQGDHTAAIERYNAALAALAGVDANASLPAAAVEIATLHSNLAAVYAKLGDGAQSLLHAQGCVSAQPAWAKGYRRLAVAFALVHKPTSAVEALCTALGLEAHDPTTVADLRRMLNLCVPDGASDATPAMMLEAGPPLACDQCRGFLCRPVTHAACGGTSDLHCIAGHKACPRCRQLWPADNLVPNICLSGIVDALQAGQDPEAEARAVLALAAKNDPASADAQALVPRLTAALEQLPHTPGPVRLLRASLLLQLGQFEAALALLGTGASESELASRDWPLLYARALVGAGRHAEAFAANLAAFQRENTSELICANLVACLRLSLAAPGLPLATLQERAAAVGAVYSDALDGLLPNPRDCLASLAGESSTDAAPEPTHKETLWMGRDPASISMDDLECRCAALQSQLLKYPELTNLSRKQAVF